MTDSYIAAKIRMVKQNPRYTELLQLQRLPMPEPEGPGMGPAPATAVPQASTTCKVLDLLGVDACAQHKRNSAAAVLARVSKGNRLCTICNTSLSSTQALRTHIQGQHM